MTDVQCHIGTRDSPNLMGNDSQWTLCIAYGTEKLVRLCQISCRYEFQECFRPNVYPTLGPVLENDEENLRILTKEEMHSFVKNSL